MSDAGFPYLVVAYMLVVTVLFVYMLYLDVRQRALRRQVEKIDRSSDQSDQA